MLPQMYQILSSTSWRWREFCTIILLSLISGWSVRPLLEEWGLFHAYSISGLSYLQSLFPLIAMRPLHLTPSALQWIAGAGKPYGVGIVAAALIVSRYLVARWAVAPVLDREQQWIFATSAAVLIGWPALLLARFHPAQLSAIFFFAAVGFAIRLSVNPRVLSFVGGALCVLALLMTYQALALIVALLPVAAFVVPHDAHRARGPRRLQRAALIVASLASGLIAYVAYAIVIRELGLGHYESDFLGVVMAQPLFPMLIDHFSTVYSTIMSSESLYVFAAISLVGLGLAYNEHANRWRVAICVASLLIVPLFSLVYINLAHLRDPERALFPASVFCVLLFGYACLRGAREFPKNVSTLVVVAILSSATISSTHVRKLWIQQRDVMQQMTWIALAHSGQPLAIMDQTGKLGDVYTFLGDTLNDAVNLYGAPADIKICTPGQVDRIHPDAARYPIETTEDCEEMDLTGRIPVDVVEIDGRLVFRTEYSEIK